MQGCVIVLPGSCVDLAECLFCPLYNKEIYTGLLLSWPSEHSISALPVPRSHIDEAVRVMIKALAVVDLGAYAIS